MAQGTDTVRVGLDTHDITPQLHLVLSSQPTAAPGRLPNMAINLDDWLWPPRHHEDPRRGGWRGRRGDDAGEEVALAVSDPDAGAA